ncbi:MAG: sulfotransferase domain-containing protein [Chloroflexota bacterium]
MVNQLSLQAKLLRRTFRRTKQHAKFADSSISAVPVLFANSFPKSGTHLLTQVLAAFSDLGPVVNSGLPAILTYDGPTGQQRPTNKILREINRLLPGDVGYGHLHALPEIVAAICRTGIAPYFVYRDPRDVVVSHVHYLTELAPNHVHHHFYKYELQNFDERLRISILGRPELDIYFPDVRARFDPYMDWLDAAEVLTLRFEDFITNPNPTLGRVFDHAVNRGFISKFERPLAVNILAGNIDPKRSPTFRSGKVGGWQKSFTDQNKALFKQTTGDLLIRLGYEKDNDW